MADINEIADGTVDDAKDKLAGLSDSDLDALLEAEKADKNRSTLIQAIESEQDTRKDKATERTKGSDGTKIKQAGDSVNRDSAANIDEGRKARLETMTADL